MMRSALVFTRPSLSLLTHLRVLANNRAEPRMNTSSCPQMLTSSSAATIASSEPQANQMDVRPKVAASATTNTTTAISQITAIGIGIFYHLSFR